MLILSAVEKMLIDGNNGINYIEQYQLHNQQRDSKNAIQRDNWGVYAS